MHGSLFHHETNFQQENEHVFFSNLSHCSYPVSAEQQLKHSLHNTQTRSSRNKSRLRGEADVQALHSSGCLKGKARPLSMAAILMHESELLSGQSASCSEGHNRQPKTWSPSALPAEWLMSSYWSGSRALIDTTHRWEPLHIHHHDIDTCQIMIDDVCPACWRRQSLGTLVCSRPPLSVPLSVERTGAQCGLVNKPVCAFVHAWLCVQYRGCPVDGNTRKKHSSGSTCLEQSKHELYEHIVDVLAALTSPSGLLLRLASRTWSTSCRCLDLRRKTWEICMRECWRWGQRAGREKVEAEFI